MDTLYVGNVPENYKYARFNDNSIDLFDVDTLEDGEIYLYYHIPLYDNYFAYNIDFLSSNENVTLTEVNTTKNICYRRDFGGICNISFAFVLFGVVLVNIVTSIIRKGGVLGGLL